MLSLARSTIRRCVGTHCPGSATNCEQADGRLLYVHMKDGSVAAPKSVPQDQIMDDAMDVDENARAREAEDKLREERRGGRGPPAEHDVLPSGPRRGFMAEENYYYDSRGGYQDGRYGFNGNAGYPRRGGGYYNDRGYGGRGGPQWRS